MLFSCILSRKQHLCMDRFLQNALLNWQKQPKRLPLIIQGARQVGKTYLMKWFGKTHFENYAYFNFDERPELKDFFEMNKDVDRIINSLSLISGIPINANTLIIFDEIQECSEALNTLKYFAEKFNLKYNKVVIKNQKTRWGSCSSKNNLNFNLNLMKLPEHLRDYVILHELAHTIEKNHQKPFWDLLDTLTDNNAKAWDKELNKYNLSIG